MDCVLITCSHCASQYSVAENLLTPGKMVRCSVCSHVWEYKQDRQQKKDPPEELPTATAPPAEDTPPPTVRRPVIPHLPIDSIPRPDLSPPTTRRPNGQDDTIQEVEFARRPQSRLRRWFSNSFTIFMIIAIVGNIVFWLYYFMHFSLDLKKMF